MSAPSPSEVEKVFEWVDKVKDFFKPFKPQVQNMRINYRTQKSEIDLLVCIPDGLKRKVAKVEIPAYQNFIVDGMMDETFRRISSAWQFGDGKWIMNPATLPASEKYLILLKGEVPEGTLSEIVRIQPAQNRDQTEEFDRYWLDSMIRNVGLLEKIWRELNIEDVNVGVHVGIERCFSATIPTELKRMMMATQRWLRAGHGRDRGEVFRAWEYLRTSTRTSKVSVGDIIDTIYKLTVGSTFTEYLTVDKPYSLGEIRREERTVGLFPEKMSVEACTELNLKQPLATGFLSFKKKEYIKRLEAFFSRLKK